MAEPTNAKRSYLSLSGKRRGVFRTLILSYLFIFMIPVAIGGLLYERMSSGLVENANRSNAAILEQIKQATDQKIREANQAVLQIATNPKLAWLLRNGRKERSPQDLYKFVEYIQELSRYSRVSGVLDHFFIYFAETGEVLTPLAKTDAKFFFDHVQVYKGMDYARIKDEMLAGYHFRTFYPSQQITERSSGERRYIPLVQSLPLGEVRETKGALVLLIDEQQMNLTLQQIRSANDSIIYIIDEQNRLIMSTNGASQEAVEPLLPRLASLSGTITGRDGRKMLLSFTSSSENGWKYVSVTPKATVMAKVHEAKNAAVLLLLLVLTAGAAACYIMAKRYYSPIRDVVNAINQGKQGKQHPIRNEFDFIKSAVSASLEEEKQLRSTLLSQAPVMKANLLNRLIKGQVDAGQETEQYLQTMGVTFNAGRFCVILIDIDDPSGFIKEDLEQEWSLIRFIIVNIGGDLLGNDGYIVELGRERLAALLHSNLPDEEWDSFTGRFQARLRDMVERRYKIRITTAVSNRNPGIARIGQCYRESLIAMDYKWIRGLGSDIPFEEVRELEQSHYHYPLEWEVQLMNHAKNGNIGAIDTQLNELFQLNFRSRSISPEMGKGLMFDLLGTILKLHHTLNLAGKKPSEEEPDPVKWLAGCSSVEEMFLKVKELFRRVCCAFSEERTDHSERLYRKVTRYIDENYGDGMLSLTVLADRFDITPQYLSHFFKKHSGQNITDYMARVRIGRAKEMLADPSLTILAIAQKVGYSNDIGLIRLFKKYEGVTPGRYRDLIKEDRDLIAGRITDSPKS